MTAISGFHGGSFSRSQVLINFDASFGKFRNHSPIDLAKQPILDCLDVINSIQILHWHWLATNFRADGEAIDEDRGLVSDREEINQR